MRDVFKEYIQGLLSWEEAYYIAYNFATSSSINSRFPFSESNH